MERSKTPPKTTLTLRVGVTGHRPENLNNADLLVLRGKINEILAVLKEQVTEIHKEHGDLYNGARPVLRIISPLAEGSDRIVAGEALKAGFELQCPLPFERAEYEHDFTAPESKQEFRDLLGQATSIFELDGDRHEIGKSYQMVGQLVLNQCDLLIAIWDGQPGHGLGGTYQIVQMARKQTVPCLWINAGAPHKITFLDQQHTHPEWQVQLGSWLEHLLDPPGTIPGTVETKDEKASRKAAGNAQLDAYFHERQRSFNYGFFYKLFLKILGKSKTNPPLLLKDFEAATAGEYEELWRDKPIAQSSLPAYITKHFQDHFAWADKLADYYADLYRSSFVLNYLFGGLAVLFALLGFAMGLTEEDASYKIPFICELVLILSIIINTMVGKRQRWHERWIDYRLLAELLRNMVTLSPLGLVGLSFRIPAHNRQDDVNNSWLNWHFRAIVRQAGLINARVNQEFLSAIDSFLLKEIEGQIKFHEGNSQKYERVTHILHRTGLVLFGATLVGCIIHLSYHEIVLSRWLTFAAAVLPALGSALVGILYQGEYERLIKRSEAMAAQLHNITTNIDVSGRAPSYEDISSTAYLAATTMVNEVLDWRIMVQARPLQLP
ncbi:MAG: hypothetical protein ACM3PE_09385 [Deltaproteobacteria bacterium]